MRSLIVAMLLVLTIPAFAQQQPDTAFLQRALNALQVQRNQAMDAAAISEAKASGLSQELTKAQARIKELETKSKTPETPQ